MPGSPHAVLIYPPLTDPTSGYHSLSYIDSYAQAQGHQPADIIDANIEAFHHSYTPGAVAWLERALAAAAADPTPETRAHLLRVGTPDPDAVRNAVRVLQDPEQFYDFGYYQRAVDAITAWMECLGAIGFPGQFRNGFHLRPPRAVHIGSLRALTDEGTLARLNRPFQPYYEDSLVPRLERGGYDLVGINITYQWQLPFALWLARLVRRALPGAFLVAGGTEVSDSVKHVREQRMVFELFADFDAVVVGEGESAYAEILDARAAGTLPLRHPNIRLNPAYGAVKPLPLLHYERLRDIPTPDYSRLPWDLYLSPTRFVYYSPTRGCYWNKCTFCDYGLNTDGPTSPWRQDTVDTMVRDVGALSRFAKFIYFSVDVLAPATILRFAERVVEQGIDVRWGAEVRLEKYWSDERCELLKRSGCTAISVGFESGNQRILDLIDKGTRPEQVRRTMLSMTKAGIGVQVMGFTGFPTETEEEALDSIRFLQDNRDLWTFGGLGEFVLTPGAIVAKQPELFGISNVRRPEGADIARFLRYDEPISQAVQSRVRAAKAPLYTGHYERPWVSSTDTPHTFFYHDRFGTSVSTMLDDDRRRQDEDETRPFLLNGVVLDDPDEATLRAYASMYDMPEALLTGDRATFRRADGRILLLPRKLLPFLDLFHEPTTLAEARQGAWMLDDASADQLWDGLIRRRILRREAVPSAAAFHRLMMTSRP